LLLASEFYEPPLLRVIDVVKKNAIFEEEDQAEFTNMVEEVRNWVNNNPRSRPRRPRRRTTQSRG
jgi:hypothetical protein